MIPKIQASEPNFKAARVNILATADNHGNIMRLPRVLKTIENNACEIFPKAESPSTKNFFAIVGDWFINPSKKGLLTHPELSNGDMQNLSLLKTIDSVKIMLKQLVAKSAGVVNNKAGEIQPLFAIGNHDLDAGTNFLLNVMKKNPMTTLVTNMNLEKSPMIVDAMKTNSNIVQSAIYSVPDDKDPELSHKLLFLGTTIPSMDFYNPGLCEGLEFFDNSNKKDANLKECDIQDTIKAIKEQVDAFKKENPKGAVVLLSHMGGRLSEIVRKNIPEIDHILNGHDHKNLQSNVGKTSINSLGKDNEMIKALNFEFDDDGNLVKASMTPYFTETTVTDGLEKHPFQKFLNSFFEKDLEPLVSINELKSENLEKEFDEKFNNIVNQVIENLGINTPELKEQMLANKEFKNLVYAEADKQLSKEEQVDKGIKKLPYGNEIRYQNSYLMNYLTSAIKRVIRQNYAPDVFSVAIQSSIVRGPLTDGADNLGVMKVFDGVSEDLSNLKMGTVKGSELVGLIVENVLANLKAPTRNTIIHWSDVMVNRSLIKSIHDKTADSKYPDAVRVRNKLTKEFEPIDLNEDYKIVIGEKFLVKDDIEWPKKIRNRFESLDKTYDQLFREYISSVDYKLNVTPKTKEKRIL